MKKLALVVSAAAVLAAPAATAQAAGPDIPEINCGIVSCTYKVEQAIETVEGETAGVRECVEGAVTAIRYILQGTPQPQECSV